MVKIPVIGMIEINSVKVHPNNVKEHPDSQIKNLMQLIEWVGFKDPIVLDKDNLCRAGHGRLIAAEKLGMDKVPFVRLEGITKKQMDLFIYMDNQINESPWIKQNVELLLKEIPKKDLELFELNWDGIRTPDYPEEINDIPEPSEKPTAKLGQIYQLGNHKVMCGDASIKEHIELLLGKITIDTLQTDPPYGIEYGDKNAELNKNLGGNRIEKPLENDNIIQDYREFAKSFLKDIPFSHYNTIYFWMSNLRSNEILMAFVDLNIKYHQTLIWIKNNHVLGRLDHNPKHESCFYAWKGQHKFYGGFKTDILTYDKPSANKLHPTMKPPEMIAELITEGCKAKDNVYDPFLGSGTTLIACEMTGRNCYGMEIDPAYVDVIIQRWENYTGKKAKLLRTM